MLRLLPMLVLAGCDLLGGSWSLQVGPCEGSATDVLMFDSADIGYAGCGENAVGTGLFETTDGGRTWASVDGFDAVRVSDVRRGPDGLLYLAGKNTNGSEVAYTFDRSTSTAEGLLSYSGGEPFMRIGHAENAAVTADGAMLVDSLTGAYVGYRASADAPWEEWYYLDDRSLDGDERVVNLRGVEALGEAFYGVGGLINDPPAVYLPSLRPEATAQMHALYLTEDGSDDGSDGELLDLVVFSASELLVAGWDQSTDEAYIARCDGDPYAPSCWERVDPGVDYAAGVNDLAVDGDRVLATGEQIPTAAGGFAWLSEDRGRTWRDVTPDGAGPLSAGALLEDGSAVVAGGGGELSRAGAL